MTVLRPFRLTGRYRPNAIRLVVPTGATGYI